jgi:sialate O-acetylesterase
MSSVIKFTLIFLFFSSTTLANVVLPKLISDGVVLQRDSENLVWGWADENESVSIKFNGRVIAKTSAQAGVWSIKLSPQVAGGPHKIDIIGKNTISVSDIYFGDVWLASGQSNMQTTMNRVKPKYPNEIEQANYPLIRYFTVPRTYDFNQPLEDVSDGQWLKINKNSLGEFSAVAYFFAKKLHLKHQVPIGILNSNYGGSPAQAWMSEEALAEFPHYLATIKKFRQANYLENLIASDK